MRHRHLSEVRTHAQSFVHRRYLAQVGREEVRASRSDLRGEVTAARSDDMGSHAQDVGVDKAYAQQKGANQLMWQRA